MPPERTARPPSGTRRHVTTTLFSPATNHWCCYNAPDIFVAISPIVPVRHRQLHDLHDFVNIDNASIPRRTASPLRPRAAWANGRKRTGNSVRGKRPARTLQARRLVARTTWVRPVHRLAIPTYHRWPGLAKRGGDRLDRCCAFVPNGAAPSIAIPRLAAMSCRSASADDLFAHAGMTEQRLLPDALPANGRVQRGASRKRYS